MYFKKVLASIAVKVTLLVRQQGQLKSMVEHSFGLGPVYANTAFAYINN